MLHLATRRPPSCATRALVRVGCHDDPEMLLKRWPWSRARMVGKFQPDGTSLRFSDVRLSCATRIPLQTNTIDPFFNAELDATKRVAAGEYGAGRGRNQPPDQSLQVDNKGGEGPPRSRWSRTSAVARVRSSTRDRALKTVALGNVRRRRKPTNVDIQVRHRDQRAHRRPRSAIKAKGHVQGPVMQSTRG